MAEKGDLSVSKNKAFEHRILNDFITARCTRAQAALLLGCTGRCVTQRRARLEKKGLRSLQHGNVGKEPVNRKFDERREAEIMSIVTSEYYDFNMTHTLEMLKKEYGIEVPYQIFRRWCVARKIMKRAKRRSNKSFKKRTRMPAEGMMIQFDGSPHKWNGKDEWCLIGGIDDATSEIASAQFHPTETTVACMHVMLEIIRKKGIPESVYVDRAGIYGGQKRQDFSQFKRACEQLGIRVIYANTAQAKGRIERSWDTFQDRLIPEMRRAFVKTMPHANTYLADNFLPGYWNVKNTVPAVNLESRYRPLPLGVDLQEIFCIKEHRGVKRNNVVSWEGELFHVKSKLHATLARNSVEFRTYLNGDVKVFFGEFEVEIRKVDEAKKAS